MSLQIGLFPRTVDLARIGNTVQSVGQLSLCKT